MTSTSTRTKNELIHLIDWLSEPEQMLLLEVAKKFLNKEINMDDIEAIRSTRREYDIRKTLSHNFVNWD